MVEGEKDLLLQEFLASFLFYEAKRRVSKTYKRAKVSGHPDEVEQIDVSDDARAARHEERLALKQFWIASKNLRDFLTREKAPG